MNSHRASTVWRCSSAPSLQLDDCWTQIRSMSVYIGFKDKGIEHAKQAVLEDEAGNYDKALTLYLGALEYLKTYLKYEKNPKSREAITDKVRVLPSSVPVTLHAPQAPMQISLHEPLRLPCHCSSRIT